MSVLDSISIVNHNYQGTIRREVSETHVERTSRMSFLSHSIYIKIILEEEKGFMPLRSLGLSSAIFSKLSAVDYAAS